MDPTLLAIAHILGKIFKVYAVKTLADLATLRSYTGDMHLKDVYAKSIDIVTYELTKE